MSTWYSDNKPQLDFSLPIAHSREETLEILMPMIGEDSYNIIGYNWFDLTKGKWNSCACFKTVELALEARAYKGESRIFNVTRFEHCEE